jgi:hypothetical protein
MYVNYYVIYYTVDDNVFMHYGGNLNEGGSWLCLDLLKNDLKYFSHNLSISNISV